MEKLTNSNENISQSPDNNGWSNFPPFAGNKPKNTEMTDLEEIHNLELNIIAKNSDVLGYNIDSKFIIWPERREQALKAKEFLDSGGDLATLSRQFGQPEGRIQEAINEELSKDALLDETLSKLPEGVKFRITPHASLSAFSTANSERITNENGEGRFHIDDGVMAQVRKIREKAASSELVVVMNQLHENKDGRLTSNIPDDPTDYTVLCQSFVEQSGYQEQAGKGLVLELGNECNMSHESDGPLFKSEAFAETVNPEAYAKFYFETAKALKSTFPDIKLSLTGTAFYDYDFTKKVVDQIQTAKNEDESLKDTKLIDVISFHPYRKTVESPTPFMKNGISLSESEIREKSEEYWGHLSNDKKDAFREKILGSLTDEEKAVAAGLSNEEVESSVAYRAYANFDHQLETLREIANQIGAEVTVGEISFYAGEWGESIDENEQEKNASHGREKGYVSLLWPGEQIVKHENSKARAAKRKETSSEIKQGVKHNFELQSIYDSIIESNLGDWEEQNEIQGRFQEFNMSAETPFLASGQSSYFNEQIDRNGMSGLKIREQDVEDSRFIAGCFGEKVSFSDDNLDILYTTLPGTIEMNYATQTFPAIIFEDVFRCSAGHELPFGPKVGEKEEDYWMRVIDTNIAEAKDFPQDKIKEVRERGARLIRNFCAGKNRIYLIPIKDVLTNKASFGDIPGIRGGELEDGKTVDDVMGEIWSLEGLSEIYGVNPNNIYELYANPNFTSEYGVAIYGKIPTENMQYIEVERGYDTMQRKAKRNGVKNGEEIDLGEQLFFS